MTKTFPRTMYVVVRDEDTKEPYLYAEDHLESFEDDDRVAVYELREIKTLAVKRELA